jgi:hypothetical protein
MERGTVGAVEPISTLPEPLNPQDDSIVARTQVGSGPRGRRFESSRPDQKQSMNSALNRPSWSVVGVLIGFLRSVIGYSPCIVAPRTRYVANRLTPIPRCRQPASRPQRRRRAGPEHESFCLVGAPRRLVHDTDCDARARQLRRHRRRQRRDPCGPAALHKRRWGTIDWSPDHLPDDRAASAETRARRRQQRLP